VLDKQIQPIQEQKQPAPQPTAPAPKPAEQPKPEEPAKLAPVAPAPKANPVSVESLIEDLNSKDGSLAKEAACRLIQRPEAVEELVSAYATGGERLKPRVLWCIRNLGEPARLWLVGVIANPNNYRPRDVKVAVEIMCDFAKRQSCSLAEEKSAKTDETKPKAEAPRNTASPDVSRDNWEKRIRLQEQLKFKQQMLARAESKLKRAIDSAVKQHNAQAVGNLTDLKELVQELRETVRTMSEELDKLAK